MADIPLSQLPADLLYKGQLDVSNPVKQAKYNGLNSAYQSSGGGGGGMPAPYVMPDIKLSDIGGSAVDFNNNTLQPGIDTAFNDYLMAARSQAKPLDIYTGLENAAGLPGLKTTQRSLSDQVNTLEDTLRGIEPKVAATTQNSLVTEGQRTGMVNAQRYPYQQLLDPTNVALGRVSQNIDRTTSDIGNKTQLALQGQQMQLDPYKQKIQLMSDRAARMMTGFTADRQAQLDIILAKVQNRQHVSDQEYQQAATLAQQEKQYQSQMDIVNKKLQYLKVTKGGSLYDTDTGTYLTSPANAGAGGGAGFSPSYDPNNPLGL